MALTRQPGLQGFRAARVSSMNQRAMGKLTDKNHLSSLMSDSPADYDKKIISLYTQTALYSNDFLQLINKSTPYFIDGNTESWKWKVSSPYRFPVITAIPDSTTTQSQIGIDGHEFQIVLDSDEFHMHEIVAFHRMYSPHISFVSDAERHPAGWIYTCTLNSYNPTAEYIDSTWLKVGQEVILIDNSIGEFDTDLPGLGKLGDTIEMYETLSSGYGFSHQITDWADARMLNGVSLDKGVSSANDVMVYQHYENNAEGTATTIGLRWEPFIETQLRKKMMEVKVSRMIWGRGGTQKSGGKKQEIKKISQGIYHKLRENGNLVQYNRGQFSLNIFRDVFGDLFYRRVAMEDRKVKVYTNEAGIELFNKAGKEDLLGAGLTIIADNRFIEGSGRNMKVKYAFQSYFMQETGDVEVHHLMELDQPQTNSEYGQNKKSTPVFIVFDVSNMDGNGIENNIREVRLKSRPSMTWGYVDGAIHHLGFAASQGMSSANMNPYYEMWMKDRSDIFVEDATRTVIIEETPQF